MATLQNFDAEIAKTKQVVEDMKTIWGSFIEMLGTAFSRIPGFGDAGKILQALGQSQKGKQIGEIEDLIVDLQTGQVQYALMEFDKAWSPVDKLFAFRMAEFQPAKEDGKLMLGVRKEALENRPSIDRSALDRTDLTDPAWTARLSQVIGTSRTTN